MLENNFRIATAVAVLVLWLWQVFVSTGLLSHSKRVVSSSSPDCLSGQLVRNSSSRWLRATAPALPPESFSFYSPPHLGPLQVPPTPLAGVCSAPSCLPSRLCSGCHSFHSVLKQQHFSPPWKTLAPALRHHLSCPFQTFLEREVFLLQWIIAKPKDLHLMAYTYVDTKVK